ncbi:DUF1330 domain-containing protein [Aurantiacibacter marinus]|uniref:DUF1330 domain-containing protein n=1 Tax=Aurantiacibacter marinus TaxID=874156 RepID=A0A0H0XPD1_9SPHN|nr:DUF1330 domain-containing protein [Aurantiacibacter marinus]KLI64458.1 hypothetical protein AAV99_02335 [Aurantiacibacter marinus]
MTAYLDTTQDAARALVMRGIRGPLVMLNLLRFREVADYSHAPQLAPAEPISGAKAYDLYTKQVQPLLEASGGRLLFKGEAGRFLIGPEDEQWDLAMLVEQSSLESFFAFAQEPKMEAILAHRTAALLDSRLLPLAQLA